VVTTLRYFRAGIHLGAGIHQCGDDGVGLRYRGAERLQWLIASEIVALTPTVLHCCISLLIWSDAAGAASVSDRTK